MQHHPGWPAWVDQQLAHLHLRLHYVEIIQAMQRRETGSDAQRAGLSAWKELITALAALKPTLQWLFVIIVVVGVMTKRLSLSDIPIIKALVGG